MSTAEGNNPTTGTTAPTAEQSAELALKNAAAVEKAAQQHARKLDKSLDSQLSGIEKGFDKLSVTLAEAQSTDIWRHLVNAEGQPFKSWATYIAAKLSSYPRLHTIARREMVAELVKAGLSVRAIAQATGTAPATAHADVQAAKGIESGTPEGSTRGPQVPGAGVTDSAAMTAKKAVTQMTNASKRAVDAMADMTDDQVREVVKAGDEARRVGLGILKLRGVALAQVTIEGEVVPAGAQDVTKLAAADAALDIAREDALAG